MPDNRDDFKPDDLYEECQTCGRAVLRSEAFKEGPDYYHPKCAGLWRCPGCGNFYENGERECFCGEKKPS